MEKNKGESVTTTRANCSPRGKKISEKLTAYYRNGGKPWNYGLTKADPRVMAYVKKTAAPLKGKTLTPEARKKLSEAAKAHGFGKWLIGRKLSEATKQKIAESQRGPKNYQWISDRSVFAYPDEFNDELKELIRNRDGRVCILCGKTEKQELRQYGRRLCVNHIDFNKKNCSPKNLNTLCMMCNKHVNHNRAYWTSYFQKNNKI